MKCRRCGASIHVSSKCKSHVVCVQKSYHGPFTSIKFTGYLCDACLKEENKRFNDLIYFMRGLPEGKQND